MIPPVLGDPTAPIAPVKLAQVRRSGTSSTGVSENDYLTSALDHCGAGPGSLQGGGSRCGSRALPSKYSSHLSAGGTLRTPSARDVEKQLSTQTELLAICREIDLLANIRHPCVVELSQYYVCQYGSRIHIILELLEGGNLKDYLTARFVARPAVTRFKL